MNRLLDIQMRDVLHFLGWRGTPVEPKLIEQISDLISFVMDVIEPRDIVKRFQIGSDGSLKGTSFSPRGNDVNRLLNGCHEAVLLAATLGARSERELLRIQAKNSGDALLLDAVLSAAIEAVCDQRESALRLQLAESGLYLTDRFSPGYGDMPIAQSGEICSVLDTDKRIGLTVSASGIMIPRKSVSAVMGISRTLKQRRPHDCEFCSMRETCALSEYGMRE